MATNLSIGIYHPSEKPPIDITQLGFVTATPQCFCQKIIEFYPNIALPIRSYLVGENQFKDSTFFINQLTGAGYPALKKYAKSNKKVELVFNELFNIDGNLKPGITEFKIISYLETILDIFPQAEIIFNEMNTYRLTHYTGNGIQDNGVLRLIQKVQNTFPNANFSLGIQTIGNKLCKGLILKSLPLVLSHIRSLDWFNAPIHFTEVGYYYDPYFPQQQATFLDEIKEIAIEYGISTLCYIYPWDGDYFHLPGQPKNSICGIWEENWNTKYNILSS